MTRKEKIQLLAGLQAGSRSIDEIVGKRWTYLSYDLSDPGSVSTGKGKVSREEARRIRNRQGSFICIYVFSEDGVLYEDSPRPWEEDKPKNKVGGMELIMRPQVGNAPLIEQPENQ